jgi:hypothetical protein
MLAVAAVCLLIGGVAGYGALAVVDGDAFADRAAATLGSDEVREEVGTRLASRHAHRHVELSPLEPLMAHAATETVAADPGFRAAFRDGALRLHDGLFTDADRPASMTVAGSGSLLRAELLRRDPSAAVPPLEDVPLFTLGGEGHEGTLRRIAPAAADLALPLSLLLTVAGLGLLGLCVWREPDHRRAAWGAGLVVAAAYGLTAAGAIAAQDFVLDNFDTGFGDAVVRSIWDAYLADLRTWALALGAAGLVVAAAAGGPRPSPATLLAAPSSRGRRALRASVLLAVAALAVRLPELVLHTGLVALAAGMVYVAAGDLLRVVAPPRSSARRLRAAALAVALLGLIAVAAIA